MSYKISQDVKRESLLREDNFKNNVFANDPELYQNLFTNNEEYLDEEDVVHSEPQNEEDFNKLMRELKTLGVID